MKYYVISKDIKAVIAGPHIRCPREAAREAMLQYLNEGVQVSPIIFVSEIGFDLTNHNAGDDSVFDTEEILIEAGFMGVDIDDEEDLI